MMWIATIVLAGLALMLDDARRDAARMHPASRRTRLAGLLYVGLTLLALGIVVAEAVHQTRAWLS